MASSTGMPHASYLHACTDSKNSGFTGQGKAWVEGSTFAASCYGTGDMATVSGVGARVRAGADEDRR
jgi:hypothetical protein